MEEQKVVWIGPDGVNPILGAVSRGRELFLSGESLEYFHSRGLVELLKEEKEVFTKKSKK